MNNYKPISILHAFDPHTILKHKYHDEVGFVWGRYIDIATAKGKDPRSLYFGTSKNSNLLTGIFLGDIELTSKVKDVSLSSLNNNIILTVKYIDDNGKLSTVKSILPSSAKTKALEDAVNRLQKLINELITTDSNINKHLKLIDSSIYIIDKKINKLDTSLNDVIELLNTGKYNYSMHMTRSSFKDGLKQIFTLYKGTNALNDSSVIEINDYTLKRLEYNDETNTLIATSWPDAIGDDIYKIESYIDADGNENLIRTDKVNDEHIKKAELNLNILEQHFANNINTNSSVNDRLTFVEHLLKWEQLFE